MARGPSGRLVIEMDPLVKRELHSKLAADGLTLKDWFLRKADDYLGQRSGSKSEARQLLMAAESRAKYTTRKDDRR